MSFIQDPSVNLPPCIEPYLNGNCDVFAAAASEITGWPVRAIMENRVIFTPEGLVSGDGLVHAFCSNPEKPDEIFDAKGYRGIEKVFEEYKPPASCRFQNYSAGIALVEVIRDKHQERKDYLRELQVAKDFIKAFYQIRKVL